MTCFKCGSNYIAISRVVMNELAPGSPTRGKKVKLIKVEHKQVKCSDCGSTEFFYRDITK